jgi:hypothetical protein
MFQFIREGQVEVAINWLLYCQGETLEPLISKRRVGRNGKARLALFESR